MNAFNKTSSEEKISKNLFLLEYLFQVWIKNLKIIAQTQKNLFSFTFGQLKKPRARMLKKWEVVVFEAKVRSFFLKSQTKVAAKTF